jgi:hypothetical protein
VRSNQSGLALIMSQSQINGPAPGDYMDITTILVAWLVAPWMGTELSAAGAKVPPDEPRPWTTSANRAGEAPPVNGPQQDLG